MDFWTFIRWIYNKLPRSMVHIVFGVRFAFFFVHPSSEPQLNRWRSRDKYLELQGGPPTSYKWSYNPSYPFIRPFIGLITPLIIGRGPPCMIFVGFNGQIDDSLSQWLNGLNFLGSHV